MATEIVIIGNPLDGFKLYGPFDDIEAARAWAENVKGLDPDYWFAELLDPVDWII